MSRGRGGGRGGRGGGRGGFGGAQTLPPMGLTFADIQNLSRDPTQLYPVCMNRHYQPLNTIHELIFFKKNSLDKFRCLPNQTGMNRKLSTSNSVSSSVCGNHRIILSSVQNRMNCLGTLTSIDPRWVHSPCLRKRISIQIFSLVKCLKTILILKRSGRVGLFHLL